MNEIRLLVLRLLYLSLEDVYTFDAVNLDDNVSEWNICARIAMYLEKILYIEKLSLASIMLM